MASSASVPSRVPASRSCQTSTAPAIRLRPNEHEGKPTHRRAARPARALVFDVFGTLVDWRGGVAREMRKLLRVGGEEADALHRRNLDLVLGRFGHDAAETLRRELTLAWHRLDA